MKKVILFGISAIILFLIIKLSNYGLKSNKPFVYMKEQNELLVERLKSHVYKLSHDIGDRNVSKYDKLQESAQYITEQFEQLKYNVKFQEYSVSNKTVKNIIATKNEETSDKKIIVVGAHYDSCHNPGADDNASGVAALLELARVVADKNTTHAIEFAAFVNEEPPFFKSDEMGSRIYTKEAKSKKRNIKAALILESIGYYSSEKNSQNYPPLFGLFYPNKGNFIGVVGNFKSRWLTSKVVSSFKKNSKFPIESVATFDFIPGVDFSDNWSFWKEGYFAVMITDTAFYRNPNYHSKTDAFDTLDYENMGEVVKGLSFSLIAISEN